MQLHDQADLFADPVGFTGGSAVTFLSSTRRFVKSATWLGDAEAPAVEGMLAAAKALDQGGVNAALLGQYRSLHKLLLNRSPEAGPADDDDDLLSPGDR